MAHRGLVFTDCGRVAISTHKCFVFFASFDLRRHNFPRRISFLRLMTFSATRDRDVGNDWNSFSILFPYVITLRYAYVTCCAVSVVPVTFMIKLQRIPKRRIFIHVRLCERVTPRAISFPDRKVLKLIMTGKASCMAFRRGLKKLRAHWFIKFIGYWRRHGFDPKRHSHFVLRYLGRRFMTDSAAVNRRLRFIVGNYEGRRDEMCRGERIVRFRPV